MDPTHVMTARRATSAAFFLALGGTLVSTPILPAAAQNRINCGIFDADLVIVKVHVRGGGSGQTFGKHDFTIQDNFSGTVRFRRKSPDDACAQPAEIVPFHLDHRRDYEDPGGNKEIVVLTGSTSRAGPRIPIVNGGVNPISGVWSITVGGAFSGTLTTIPPPERREPTVTTNLDAHVWSWGQGSTVAEIPIPTNDPATIVREVVDPTFPGVRWTATITVSRGPNLTKFLDPCLIYGSIIGCEEQTLGESIPLTGVPFRLHYRSDRFGPPITGSVWTHKALSIGGWSLAIHHSWDPATESLYLGDGSRQGPFLATTPAVALGPAGSFLIASKAGDEVFLFDQTGRHLKTLDAVTGSVRYEFSYHATGTLSLIRDSFRRALTIERDATGRPTALVAPSGDRTILVTNALGLLGSAANSAGGTWNLGYSIEGRLTSFADPLGQIHRYVYDASGRLVRDASPAGSAFTLSRKGTDTETQVTVHNPSGALTTFEINRAGLDVSRSITLPDGSRTVAQASGPETTVTMADGTIFTTTAAADADWGGSGPPESIALTTPAGLNRSLSTTLSVTQSSPNNPFSVSRREMVASVDGKEFRSVYDADTRTYALTTPSGRSLTAQYGDNGVPTVLTRAGLAAVRLTHDAAGRLTEVRSGDQQDERRVRFMYDSKGRLESAADALGQIHRFTYDGLNRLVSRSHGGNETRYTYDALGRTISFQPPGRPEHRLQYTPNGSIGAYLPPGVTGASDRVTFALSPAGSLASVTRLDGRSVKLARNSAGEVSSATTSAGVLSIERNAKTGRVAQSTSTSGVRTAFTFDGPLLTNIAYSGGVTGSVAMQYGVALRLEGVTVGGAPATSYTYDDDGLLVSAGEHVFTRDKASGLLVNASVRSLDAEWSYNVFGEMIGHAERAQGRPLYQVAYVRDALGRIVKKSETLEGTAASEEYAFDLAGRLVRVVRDGREYARYEYDPNGNRIRTIYANADFPATYDDQDRVLSQGDVRFAWTGHGELQSRTLGGDIASFVFDELGELRSVRTPLGRTVEYLTDADGRRVGRRIDGKLADAYLYDADGALVAWLDGGGALRATFTHGRRTSVPESMLSGGVLYRLVTDHSGSVRLVVNATTGEVAQRLDYDAFGRVLRDSKPGFQPFGFAGGLVDAETGLVRFGVRDYDPEGGRWISKDPLLFTSAGTNFYQYVGNDPVNRSDPSGLWALEVSFGVGSVGLTYEPGVGLSGSVAVGVAPPGGSVSPTGQAYVPADVESSDFMSRDTKLSVEGKVAVGFGSIAGVSATVALEQQADRYGIRCGPWSPVVKGEICVLGVCVDTEGQPKGDLGQMSEIARGNRSVKVGASAEAVVKFEGLIWSAR